MRKLFLLVFIISMLQHSFAQNNLDSLDKKLKAAGSDSAKGNILRVLYRNLVIADPDSAVKICLLHKTHFEKTDNRQGVAWTLFGLSGAFRTIGDYQQSTEWGLQSLKIFETAKDTLGIINALNVTAISIAQNGDPHTGISYYKKILDYTRLFTNKRTEALAKNNIADSYMRLEQPDSALPYISAFMEYASATNDEYESGLASGNYGTYYKQKKEYELALPYFNKSGVKLLEVNDLFDYSDVSNNIAEVYFSLHQYDSSRHYAYRAVNISRQNSFNQYLMDGYIWLYKNYEQQYNSDSAFKYLKLSLATKDSLFNEEKARKVQSLTFTEQIRQQEIATKEAIAAKERRDNLQLLFISIFIVSFLIVVLLMGVMHVKPRTVEFLGLVGLLLLFEFINLTIHPFVGELTNHMPVFMLLIMVGIAALLVPAHHKLTEWVKEKIAHNALKKKN